MCSRNEDKIYFADYKHYLILCFAFFCIVNHHKFKIEPYIGITAFYSQNKVFPKTDKAMLINHLQQAVPSN